MMTNMVLAFGFFGTTTALITERDATDSPDLIVLFVSKRGLYLVQASFSP